jgi:hypothetical protein
VILLVLNLGLKKGEGLPAMGKIGARSAGAVLFFGIVAVLPFVTPGLAVAVAGTIPNLPGPTCSAGQAKLDYEVTWSAPNGASVWANTCGTGVYTWQPTVSGQNGIWLLSQIRMPTTPTHRVWLHAPATYADGSTGTIAWCIYSQNTDVAIPGYHNNGSYSVNWQDPNDVQVSDNTSPC